VTVRQLLTSTSGIKDHLNELHGTTCNGTSPEEITARIGELPLNAAPGSQWLYSNTNYVLLGMIVQRVSGRPFDEFLAERVFRPLGMKETRRNRLDDLVPNRAAGYFWDGSRLRNSPFLDPTLYDNADAGLLSSVSDLARWDAALYGDGLLKKSIREQMWTPAKLADGSTYPYGFGWFLDEVNGHRLVYHDGNRSNGSSMIGRFVDDGLTVIVLANRNDVAARRIALHVAGLMMPALMPADATIEDTEPRVTALVKAVLLAIQDGTVGPEPFTPEMWKGFYPAGVQGFQSALRSSGAFKSLALLSRKSEGDARTYRYRAVFGETSLVLDFTFTKENKISAMVGSAQ
jgi:CubicO group peptidase (beta-lactamase class C family)